MGSPVRLRSCGGGITLETMRTDYIEKGREEGLELGEERYNKLLKILLDKNDYITLKKVTVDPDFRQKMFEHYGL